jgi:hypothetical protein
MDRNNDGNNIVGFQPLLIPLKVKFNVSLTKLLVCLLELSDEVTISLCRLTNTELTATNAGYMQNSTGNSRLP